MKRYLLIVLFILMLPAIYAQGNRREVIEAEKVAFFTRTLNITTGEAKVFWPLYNEYSDKRDELVREKNQLTRQVGQNFKTMSEQELEEAGDQLISLDIREAELKADYHEKFKKVLSPSKVVRLYYAETRFKTYLLNQLRSRRENRLDNSPRRR